MTKYCRTDDAKRSQLTKMRLRRIFVTFWPKNSSLAEKPPKDLDRSPVILILSRKKYNSVQSLKNSVFGFQKWRQHAAIIIFQRKRKASIRFKNFRRSVPALILTKRPSAYSRPTFIRAARRCFGPRRSGWSPLAMLETKFVVSFRR